MTSGVPRAMGAGLVPMTAQRFCAALLLGQALLYVEPRAALILFGFACLALVPKLEPIGVIDPARLWPWLAAMLMIDATAVATGFVAWRFPLQGDANIFTFLKTLACLPMLVLMVRLDLPRLAAVLGLLALFVGLSQSMTSVLAVVVATAFLMMLRYGAVRLSLVAFAILVVGVLSFPLWFPPFDAAFHALGLDVINPGKLLARVLIWRDAHAILVPFDAAWSIARDVAILGVTERFAHPHNIAFEGARRIGFVPYALVAGALVAAAAFWRGPRADALRPPLAALTVALSVDYSLMHFWPIAFAFYALAVVRSGESG